MLPRQQKNRTSSPWSVLLRIKILLWEYSWVLLCRWTPKPFNGWRVFLLKIFGAKIYGKVFVHQRARIQMPWNIILQDGSSVGDRANLYSLGLIEIGRNSVIAQEAYLCTGTHDFKSENYQLIVNPITIEENVFIGARSFILPGITIEKNAIIGACSVVTKSVLANSSVAGNPAKLLNS
jgi:putative colanic acid biosynthesis acetyltransferase WcaF